MWGTNYRAKLPGFEAHLCPSGCVALGKPRDVAAGGWKWYWRKGCGWGLGGTRLRGVAGVWMAGTAKCVY